MRNIMLAMLSWNGLHFRHYTVWQRGLSTQRSVKRPNNSVCVLHPSGRSRRRVEGWRTCHHCSFFLVTGATPFSTDLSYSIINYFFVHTHISFVILCTVEIVKSCQRFSVSQVQGKNKISCSQCNPNYFWKFWAIALFKLARYNGSCKEKIIKK